MKRAMLLATLALATQWGLVQAASAAEGAAKPDASKGQAIVSKVCVACHGADGNSPSPVNPKLAGQIPDAHIVTIDAGHACCTMQSEAFVPGLHAAVDSVVRRITQAGNVTAGVPA